MRKTSLRAIEEAKEYGIRPTAKDLKGHEKHKLALATYGDNNFIYNAALECESCNEVLVDKEINKEVY